MLDAFNKMGERGRERRKGEEGCCMEKGGLGPLSRGKR